jgi:L-threonylcarbamoyladenylate synthase
MSRVVEVDPADRVGVASAVRAAAELVLAGQLVVLPTDTVYGIACRPDDPAAIDRLFEAKRRPTGLNLPVLAASTRDALGLALADDVARRLASAFWPGPLTLVLPRSDSSKGWRLGETMETIAIRVPDHELALALLTRTGPLAASSANISGEAPLRDPATLREAFGLAVAVYVIERNAPDGSFQGASTVVDLTGAEPRVLREGPIDADAVSRVAAESSSGARRNPHSVH